MGTIMKNGRFHLLTVGTLLWGAFFCVGMGMEMAPTEAELEAKKSHACCPIAPKEDENRSGPDCCSFIPGAAGSAPVLPDTGPVLAALPAPVVIGNAVVGDAVAGARAPPKLAPPELSPPSVRAPPAV
jgi:hypothetical protein